MFLDQVCLTNYQTGKAIVAGTQNSSTKTKTYSIQNVISSSTTNYYNIATETSENSFFSNSSVISEINAKSSILDEEELSLFSTEKWAEKFNSTNSVSSANSYMENLSITKSTKIVNAYTSYKNSSITKTKNSTYTVDATDPKGYYSYGLFNSYYVYLILVLDEVNKTSYYKYNLYPVSDDYYYGVQYYENYYFEDDLDQISIELKNVIKYLNFDSDNLILSKENYTITFNSNGGSTVSSKTVTSGSTISAPTTPTKSGYTFAGWYTNSSLTTEFDFTTTITSNITLYAKWVLNSTNKYTVTFNSNGGTSVGSKTVTSGSTISAPTTPTKSGYTFASWYTNSSPTTEFDFTTTITSNITLYAKWVSDSTTTYTVTFNSEGGSSVSSKTVTSGSTISAPTSPTRTGCKFAGWYTSYNYTTEYDFSTKVTSNIKLYAKWILTTSSPLTLTSSSTIWSNGVSIYLNMKNVSSYDIYYIENVNMEVTSVKTNYTCASAYFGTVKPTNYFMKNSTISNWDFFYDTSCCDLTYWKNNTFTFNVHMSYDSVVLPNELK